jgi:hypothetical protein
MYTSEESLSKGAAVLSYSKTTKERGTIPFSVGFNTAGTGATFIVSEESLAMGAVALKQLHDDKRKFDLPTLQ